MRVRNMIDLDRIVDDLVSAANAAAMAHNMPPTVGVALYLKLDERTKQTKALLASLAARAENTAPSASHASNHVQEALAEVDRIAQAPRKGFMKPYTLADAQSAARGAAAALRKAWDLLEPREGSLARGAGGGEDATPKAQRAR
jgi:hypothetical protein